MNSYVNLKVSEMGEYRRYIMGPIQIIILFAIFVFTKNYIWKRGPEKSTVLGTAIEIIVIVIVVLALDYFFPLLR